MPDYIQEYVREKREDDMSFGEQYVALPLMTVSEAAKYLGVGRRVIYQLIEWGEIRTVRVQGTAMVEKRSLDEYRASGKMN